MPAGNSRAWTEPSADLGTSLDFIFAGSTNAIVTFDAPPDMNLGIEVAIFFFP